MPMNGALWVTNHDGKMKGIHSIGTSCVNNPWCIKRRENGESVCSRCYAETYMKMRKSLKQRLSDNADILTTRLLEEREIPFTNDLVFRFESFGDLYNATHLQNYLLICDKNPYTNFGLWTKNTWILDDVFNKKAIEKPENLSVVVSSPMLNKQMELDKKRYWFVDHIFTVYDKKSIEKDNICINCGSKDCFGCQICYHKGTDFYVREKLK
jgi:phage pi2 protein 07